MSGNIIIPGPYPREQREPIRQKEFTDLVGGEHGEGKSFEAIRATTKKEPKPKNYRYGQQLPEWERAETQLSRDEFVRCVEPMHDRIVVQLYNEPFGGVRAADSRIMLTDAKPLIGGLRKAVVLKTGPGRWIPGEWWYCSERIPGMYKEWTWFPGYRRPVSVLPGQTVLIGNWTDLEIEDIALCQEGDVRSIWGT